MKKLRWLLDFRRDRAEADIVTPVRWHCGRRAGGVPQMRPILLP